MPENSMRLTELLNRYASKTSSQEDENELFELLNQTENEEIEGALIALLEQTQPMPDENRRQRLLKRILNPALSKNKTFPIRRIAAAASIVLALGIGSYFFFFNKTARKNDIVKTNDTIPHDIQAPKGTKAKITLADGRTVSLDSIANGTLATQGNVNVVKTADGQVVYNGTSAAVEYNIFTNPRGNKVQSLTLSDGTQIWLNSESSLRYPTSFMGRERKVEVTGEVYFEVAHDAAKPFYVSKGDMQVQVLGTHFNVHAYDDESDIKVTLLEGSVRVVNRESSIVNRQSAILKPGQQAILAHDSQLTTHGSVDLDAVMAWKNGYFHFGNTRIQDLMKQLSRWYDVEIIYEGKVPERQFGGEISREANLSQVLKILNESKVKCRLDGNKLVIE